MPCGCKKEESSTSSEKHSNKCKCQKCSSTTETSSTCHKCSSSTPCECESSSSSSIPECSELGCEKICFGHWGAPKCNKCDRVNEYEECDFDKIPTGSLWFGFQIDAFGTVRTLASKECWNRVGIVVQAKAKRDVPQTGCGCKKVCKCYVKVPMVFSIWYNGQISFEKLSTLSRQPTMRKMAVRPLKPSCNRCTDEKLVKHLWCVMEEYLKQKVSFEKDGAAVMRGLFNLDVSNPNFQSYSDTKLVYSVLFKAALLNDKGCCEQSSPSCSSPESSGRTTSRLTCESNPCESTCCESSSVCDKCELDCFQASQATIKDFLYSTADCGCLDLRWFSSLVPVFTKNAYRGLDEAIDEAFACQGGRLLKDLRQIAGAWISGRDLPCCNQCRDCNGRANPNYKPGKDADCGCGEKKNECSSSTACPPVSCQEATAALTALDTIYTYLSGVNYANLPTPLPITLNGNDLTTLFNTIRAVVQQTQCQCLTPYVVNSTYTYPTGSTGIFVNFTAPVPPTPPGPPPCASAEVAERLISQFGANPLTQLLGQ